ncbi:MAG: hypothetical protein Q9160_009273 [Pyrenula sp. 1 TL-2023]
MLPPTASPVKDIIIIGATGSIGPALVHALASHSARFHVSIYTRSASKARGQFSDNVTIHVGDYSNTSLLEAFTGQDVVISTITTFSTPQQKQIIDVAVQAGVKRFLPSEFGIDTSDPTKAEYLPILPFKQGIVDYLKTKQDKLSWSAFITGGFLDWTLSKPGAFGYNIPSLTANIYDSGNTPHEVTNIKQIGRAVAVSLSTPALFSATTNQYIYINSFTITQNQLIAELENDLNSDGGDKKFTITHKDSKRQAKEAQEVLMESMKGEGDFVEAASGSYARGAVDLIECAVLADYGGMNHYSKREGGLWNERLGLPKEKLAETVRQALEGLGMLQGRRG